MTQKNLDEVAKTAYHAEIDRQTAEGREQLDWMKCWQASVDAIRAKMERRVWVWRFAWTFLCAGVLIAWKLWQP
jgi:hypothetical protein